MYTPDSDVSRFLTLLRNKIRQQGFTQLEVQQTLGWGRSYISQLLTRQKNLRLDQVLLILETIGIEPESFFAELYWPAAPYLASRTSAPQRQATELPAQLRDLKNLLAGLVKVLAEKQLIAAEDLRR
ncbi:MAG: helix-turn-helix transcriptional regulator [bacterium]|nr:helix-turn-helix transcriptional regulator [bacterium]